MGPCGREERLAIKEQKSVKLEGKSEDSVDMQLRG